jgi:alpha-amylase
MWRSKFATDGATFKHVQRLTALRRQYAPLRRGDLHFTWASAHTGAESDAGMLAYERRYEGETVLVVLNTSARQTSATTLNGAAMAVGFAPGTGLVDVYGTAGETFTVAGDGTVEISVPPLSVRVLVAR